MSKFIKGLAKRGIWIRFNAGEIQLLPRDLVTDSIRETVDANRDSIIADIKADLEERAKDVKKMLRSLGYAFIWSDLLQQRMILVKDEETRERLAGHILPKYTLQECEQLLGCDDERIETVNQVKKTFGGRVEPIYPEGVSDPRPDITDDHELWERLLGSAKASNLTLYGLLCGFRSFGAMLTRSLIGWSITFDVHQSEGWADRAAYNADYQEYLQPHVKLLRQLLKSLEAQERAA